VRCGRSCSAAAVARSAREQWGRAWRTSEAVEEKAAEGMALMQADHGPRGGRGGECGAAKRRRRSRRNWTGASTGASGSVLPVAGSVRFRRRVRVQGNRPCASRLRASGVRAERERRTGDATKRGGPA
jgi:hypothetical protein